MSADGSWGGGDLLGTSTEGEGREGKRDGDHCGVVFFGRVVVGEKSVFEICLTS